MARTVSIGRVKGSMWYTDLTNVFPLEGDMWFDKNTHSIYQYKNKNWIRIDKLFTKLSQFENDTNFVDSEKLDSFLEKKADITYVNDILNNFSSLDLKTVDNLPTENISTTSIYLLKTDNIDDSNIYEEYIYVNNAWELIGTTEVDLTEYAKKTEIPVKISQLKNDSNLIDKDYVDKGLTEKVDKEFGKGLSTNDFTDDEKNKLNNTYTKEETTELISDKEDKENLIIKTEVGTSKDLGGIKAGTVLKGQTVLSVLEQLLFPYITFTMNVQSVSPTGTYEKGTSVTIKSVTVRITAGTKPVTNIKLYESNKTTLLGEKTSGIVNDNTFSINKTVTSSVSFYATATDGTSNLSDSSSFLAFYDPTFYGVLDVGYTLTSDLITGKTKDLKANKSNTRTYNATNQHPFLAYPSSYGTLTSIKDGNGFECIGDFNNLTINLNVKSGTVSYRVYVLKSATTGTGYKYTFS